MIELTKDTFQAEVKDAQGLVLVDFWSESCEPCKALLPEISSLAEKYGAQVKFTKLDATKARRLAISEQVLGLPTITLYKDGKKAAELTKDNATASNIEAMVQKAI
ncbi:MAG: thioredoxin [Treponema sp.]|nr:thioredoxin [Treponema sp.]